MPDSEKRLYQEINNFETFIIHIVNESTDSHSFSDIASYYGLFGADKVFRCLPDELLLEITSQLNTREQFNLARTNRGLWNNTRALKKS
ncbi:hypothetical protein BD770DRAFT_468821 [Pilaira anomala]|nr:hypothetical protein BD770DRAFT_468821 [Pilaira anomala]